MDVGDQLGMRLSFLDSGAKEEEQLGDCQSCSGASMQSIGKGCKTGKLNQHGGLRCDSVPACTRQNSDPSSQGAYQYVQWSRKQVSVWCVAIQNGRV
jgi:hypothetical protein